MATEKLIVKNFGPIREAELDLRKVTVLIGEQASGKSVLAKLATILCSGKCNDNLLLLKYLEDYGLDEFNNNKSSIFYENPNHIFYLDSQKNTVEFGYKDKKLVDLKVISSNISSESLNISINHRKEFQNGNYEEAEQISIERDIINAKLHRINAQIRQIEFQPSYIPVERASFFVQKRIEFNFTYLNDFIKKFEEKKNLKPQIDIISGKAEYVFNFDENAGFIYINDDEYFSVSKVSSGIHSLLPLKVMVESTSPIHKNYFIVEEPELNLYPTTQKKLVEYLIEKCTKGDNRLIITTHSPYILTALNNCIQAHNVAKLHPENAEEVNKLVPPQYQIAYEDVSAYYVGGGTVKSIMNEEFQMIDANALDDVSEELSVVFDKLLDLKYQNQD